MAHEDGTSTPGALRMLIETVKGVPVLNAEHDDVCRGCTLGKYEKASFPRSDSRENGMVGLIHLDIFGPMSTRALSSGEYFVTFIDDHSGKTWIYFLKIKHEVFDWFREFKALVENATGKNIKVLCSDNGGEYIDKDFTYLCVKEGIKREWTNPYNPQQNGVTERKNRTIVGAAKAMLYDQDLPRFLSAKACNTTVYIQNRTPHRALGKKTPKGVFTGKKLEVSDLRIFGSMTYCHKPDDKHSKLDQIVDITFPTSIISVFMNGLSITPFPS